MRKSTRYINPTPSAYDGEEICNARHLSDVPFVLGIKTKSDVRIYKFANSATQQFEIRVGLPLPEQWLEQIRLVDVSVNPRTLIEAVKFVMHNESEFTSAVIATNFPPNRKVPTEYSPDDFLAAKPEQSQHD